MLIFTRRIGESVFIDQHVRVTVLSVRGNHVRLGIEAPRNVPVHREEVHERIKVEQGAAGPKERTL